jgi:hypothetical protein
LNNINTYVNMLRVAGHDEGKIQAVFEGRPLCWANKEAYEAFCLDLSGLSSKIEQEKGWKHVQFVFTGSSVPGFSQNPLKGHRDLPSKICDPLKSDVDICVVGGGVNQTMLALHDDDGSAVRLYPTITGLATRGTRYGIKPETMNSFSPAVGGFLGEWSAKLPGGLQLTFMEDDQEIPPWEMFVPTTPTGGPFTLRRDRSKMSKMIARPNLPCSLATAVAGFLVVFLGVLAAEETFSSLHKPSALPEAPSKAPSTAAASPMCIASDNPNNASVPMVTPPTEILGVWSGNGGKSMCGDGKAIQSNLTMDKSGKMSWFLDETPYPAEGFERLIGWQCVDVGRGFWWGSLPDGSYPWCNAFQYSHSEEDGTEVYWNFAYGGKSNKLVAGACPTDFSTVTEAQVDTIFQVHWKRAVPRSPSSMSCNVPSNSKIAQPSCGTVMPVGNPWAKGATLPVLDGKTCKVL